MHTLSGEFDGGERVVLGAGEERTTEQGACLEVVSLDESIANLHSMAGVLDSLCLINHRY